MRKNLRHSLNFVLILLVAIFAGLSQFVLFASTTFGPKIDAVVAGPDSVKAWRTVGSLRQSDQPFDYYKKSGEGSIVPPAISAQLSKVLLDPKTYPGFYRASNSPPPPAKDCAPLPGVALRFTKGKHSVEFFVCFDCGIYLLCANPDKEPPPANGSERDFDFGYNKLLHIVKQIFPNDPQIKDLKDRDD